jgi:thiamine kinase-like enzyme
MLLSNLFQNKAYVIPKHIAEDDSEIELVQILLRSLDEPILAQNIEFLATTEDYDIFKYNHNNLSYCIKISLDENCKTIINEAKILTQINPLIRPQYIKDGVIKIGDSLRYLITSYENAESLNELGRSYFLENFDSFCYTYALMQDSKVSTISYKEYLSNCFNMADLENTLTEDAIDGIKNYTNFNLIKEIMMDMQNELMLSYDDNLSEKKFICHGDLNMKNIISRNGLFKFINFEKCYNSHCFLDLNDIIIELGIPENMELNLLERFCSNMQIEFNKDTLKLYKKCYEVTLIAKGIKLIMDYLKEVYLYSSHRIDKIIEISDKFSQSYDKYMSISHFQNNKDFILKTLTEPILSEKA